MVDYGKDKEKLNQAMENSMMIENKPEWAVILQEKKSCGKNKLKPSLNDREGYTCCETESVRVNNLKEHDTWWEIRQEKGAGTAGMSTC